ncbi:MAG: response regulator [Candidatus Komeilibacteria bacterium CG11_big_fil_rev_8_21_14_0_20_36_20]|uniref:Response regulator n=1 Tax=Candidatus Komeilibacteria bacterium CG11_big_fil_rev_8_21_14_0_20_36_20 TaxID=1974477 RepID=A0A2H0NFB4_9BACT|nr:MAG: response regulator [Candidatus Komeilibacteria bacterium CG11_big_fil_rev_8_21_14_0_20_36_20]PIR81569.1 MAG: response regulator [Candidatus Komeilibacteria bacterium CG10_big_fil_rev_8_21_14_0_10_36_65]PJC55407.1 MAG: response regulator [Candidatus Komeilibacteria bacterium CG_4_9_14_0_2_um_filter_36_13]
MKNYKILIVEDDEFLLQMYTTKLNLEGFKVLGTPSGKQGLKMAKKDTPDLILLDLMLLEMNGIEVLENLKIDDNTKNIPVIILTNYSQKENIDRCLELGADDYLIKAHFVPSEVIVKIKKILSSEN